MAAPLGNKFWLARATHGRKKIFSCPDEVWVASCEYFEWVEKNPLKEEKMFAYLGTIKRRKLNKMRAMTLEGLYLFLGIGSSTWSDYRNKEDFSEIMHQVENVIRSQKFAGAAADLLNANIIARDLGLRDKSETDITSGGEPIKNEWHVHPVTTKKD